MTTALGKDEVALLMWMRRVILVLGQYSIIACPNGDRESDRNKLQQLIGFVGWHQARLVHEALMLAASLLRQLETRSHIYFHTTLYASCVDVYTRRLSFFQSYRSLILALTALRPTSRSPASLYLPIRVHPRHLLISLLHTRIRGQMGPRPTSILTLIMSRMRKKMPHRMHMYRRNANPVCVSGEG